MAERTLLAVSAVPIEPVRDGYSLRVRGLLEELSTSWDVVRISPPDGGPLPARLGPCIELPARFDALTQPAPDVREALLRAAERALAERRPATALLWPGCELLGLERPGFPPFVADRVDCHALALARSLRHGGGERGRLRTFSDLVDVARYERRVVRHAAATVVVGEDDARTLRRLGGRGEVHVVSNGVRIDVEAGPGDEAPRPTVAFTGVLCFPPNVDAALHLCSAVWPMVRGQLPDAELVIAGREPTPEVRALAALPGVTIRADVPDLRRVLREAWLCVAPMRTGSGVKNKVLEAWACARPVVLSPIAANGLALDAEGRALVAEDAAAMAERIVALLRSPTERHRLGEALRRRAGSAHGWEPAARRLSDILERAARSAGG